MTEKTFKHVETMIGADAVVKGHLLLKGGVIVYGKVYGNIRTGGPIRIARKAYVKGDVYASDAYIGGTVEGNLTTNGKVVLRSHSSLTGDLVYRRLVIEEGAQFEGKCDLVDSLETSELRSTGPDEESDLQSTTASRESGQPEGDFWERR